MWNAAKNEKSRLDARVVRFALLSLLHFSRGFVVSSPPLFLHRWSAAASRTHAREMEIESCVFW